MSRLTRIHKPVFATLGLTTLAAVAALAADPEVMRHTGNVLVAASVALDYGFTDIDGKSPRPLALTDV